MADKSKRRVLQGVVTSNRMERTITVRVERMFKHPKYHKYIRSHTKYHADDAKNDANIGDVVEIMECRPMSKLKRWRLVRVISRSALAEGGVV